MTVAELIKLLRRFPPQFPVFISLEDGQGGAIAPEDAVMNLVHERQRKIIDDDGTVPDGFVDSVVIYPYRGQS